MTVSQSEPVLPTGPEEINAEWIASILGLKVKSIEMTQSVLQATASKIFVTITYDESDAITAAATKPARLCLKGGLNSAIVNSMADILIPIYQREVYFFNEVAPKLNSLEHIELPKSWWAGANAKQGICALEDLTQRGCTFGEPLSAWPVARVLAGVEQLAGLHADTWGASTADYPWIHDPNIYESTMFGLCSMWEAMARGDDRPYVPTDWTQERLANALKKHFANRDPRFRCFLHGDPHVGNTFLDGEAARFLDWQLIHIGSSLHDVAYFVVGAMSVEDRREHEVAILEHYLAALDGFGGPKFTVDDVMVEYRKSVISGLGWMLTPIGLQSRERVHVMSSRYLPAIQDHKTIELLESI